MIQWRQIISFDIYHKPKLSIGFKCAFPMDPSPGILGTCPEVVKLQLLPLTCTWKEEDCEIPPCYSRSRHHPAIPSAHSRSYPGSFPWAWRDRRSPARASCCPTPRVPPWPTHAARCAAGVVWWFCSLAPRGERWILYRAAPCRSVVVAAHLGRTRARTGGEYWTVNSWWLWFLLVFFLKIQQEFVFGDATPAFLKTTARCFVQAAASFL